MSKYLLFLFSLSFNLLFTSMAYGAGFEKVSLAKTILQLIFLLVVFAGVILLTVYGTRFLASNYKNLASSKYANIIDSISLPGGTKLVLVDLFGKVYILAISNTGTTLVDTLELDDLPISEESFDNYLNKYLGKWNIKSNNKDKNIFNRFFNKKDKEESNDETKN